MKAHSPSPLAAPGPPSTIGDVLRAVQWAPPVGLLARLLNRQPVERCWVGTGGLAHHRGGGAALSTMRVLLFEDVSTLLVDHHRRGSYHQPELTFTYRWLDGWGVERFRIEGTAPRGAEPPPLRFALAAEESWTAHTLERLRGPLARSEPICFDTPDGRLSVRPSQLGIDVAGQQTTAAPHELDVVYLDPDALVIKLRGATERYGASQGIFRLQRRRIPNLAALVALLEHQLAVPVRRVA